MNYKTKCLLGNPNNDSNLDKFQIFHQISQLSKTKCLLHNLNLTWEKGERGDLENQIMNF